MSRTRILLALAALAAGLPLARSAAAVDGVLEIHPACVATGCFSGDGPGYPVEIAQPGSYRLTGDLQVPDENSTAILVQSDDVSIDLNGFAVRGVTTCSFVGGGVTCSPTGSGRGVDGGARDRLTVRHGVIRGMGGDGLFLGESARVEGLAVEENGGVGVLLQSGRASAVTARLNGLSGIAGLGISPINVENSAAVRNGTFGFQLMGTLSASSAVGNVLDGVRCTAACTVTGSQIEANGRHGIEVLNFGTVRGNTVTLNADFGLAATSGATVGYAENTFFGNNGGGGNPQVDGANAIQIGTNLCQSNTTCP